MAGEEAKEVNCKEENSILEQEIASLKQELSSIKGMLSSMIATNQQKNPTNDMLIVTKSPLFSTGNRGVQTNQQTDIQAAGTGIISPSSDILSMVESLKSELKVKFRSLSKQEFKVFSSIYILEEQGEVDYRSLAKYLCLSEGSIRDYMMKLQNKGIPVVKTKANNKKVLLNIRQELRQIASLNALMQIREPIFK